MREVVLNGVLDMHGGESGTEPYVGDKNLIFELEEEFGAWSNDSVVQFVIAFKGGPLVADGVFGPMFTYRGNVGEQAAIEVAGQDMCAELGRHNEQYVSVAVCDHC